MALDRELAIELYRLEKRLRPWVGDWNIVKDITFPAANTRRDVAHGMVAVPDGFSVIWADGPVYAAPGQIWTNQIAYLQTNAANIHAVVAFFRLRQE